MVKLLLRLFSSLIIGSFVLAEEVKGWRCLARKRGRALSLVVEACDCWSLARKCGRGVSVVVELNSCWRLVKKRGRGVCVVDGWLGTAWLLGLVIQLSVGRTVIILCLASAKQRSTRISHKLIITLLCQFLLLA